ncbi:MAG TPA: hypothetical protein VE291_05800 [Terracidiphilus sp.]|jgi:hypothetical protein|nr:hypothetical protein [Terracidiphilus sp.]
MNHGLSDQVRALAVEKFVGPAIRSGKARFSVAVRDVMVHLLPAGFPANHWPQICSALQAEKFLRANGLEIESVDGPPSKKSTTVVVHYRVVAPAEETSSEHRLLEEQLPVVPAGETPEEWAHRMTGKLCGLMKDEFAAFGGGEAFLRWVRGYDEEDAA